MKAWPASVWHASALRDLDERARTEIARAGMLRALGAGEVVYRAGERAPSLFAVVSGRVEVKAAFGGARAVGAGETFGEEAFVAEGLARRAEAIARARTVVAEIPGALLRRVLERSASRTAERVDRVLSRSAARERLRAARFARAWPDEEIELLLDAASHVHLARGESIPEDLAGRAFIVASGLVRIEDARSVPRRRAYLGVGDLFEEDPRAVARTAAAPSWLLALDVEALHAVERRAPGGLAEAARQRAARWARAEAIDAAAPSGRSVLEDLHRLKTARSLLVIDPRACVDCGHCAWSCASAHDDGVARLLRRGETIDARPAGEASARPLFLANACQHCESPACLPACPTGAIVHTPRGEVQIRPSLCTGCGACAKACPWEAIRMDDRGSSSAKGASLAVKCDLCEGASTGPACVDACPTEALQRILPRAALPDVNEALGRGETPAIALARSMPTWPFVAFGLAVSIAVLRLPLGAMGSGACAGASLALLAAHSVWKRAIRRFGRAAYVAHLSLAPIALAATARHVTSLPANAAGALAVATALALASGGLGFVAYRLIPGRLARLTRGDGKVDLPEEVGTRSAHQEADAFAILSGSSARVKKVFEAVVAPYLRSRTGALGLALAGSGAAEVAALTARLAPIRERLEPAEAGVLQRAIAVAVDGRLARVERGLRLALRGWLPVHVVAAAIALALLAVHVAVVTVFR
ncbi:MAG TPA: cyclic nucleotide-binding domain-containing protein [Polyangiaceae bacterium]